MPVRNVEVQKTGEGYTILEQSGSDPRSAAPTHRAHDRSEAESWLTAQGGDPAEVARVLDEAETGGSVYLELGADWSEAEKFPRK